MSWRIPVPTASELGITAVCGGGALTLAWIWGYLHGDVVARSLVTAATTSIGCSALLITQEMFPQQIKSHPSVFNSVVVSTTLSMLGFSALCWIPDKHRNMQDRVAKLSASAAVLASTGVGAMYFLRE